MNSTLFFLYRLFCRRSDNGIVLGRATTLTKSSSHSYRLDYPAVSGVFQVLILVLGLGFSSSSIADEPLEIELQEGVKYEKITGARSTYRDGKIEVVEFFWYGCPHCFELLPSLTEWEKSMADDVNFDALALAGSKRWTLDAQVYFTARALALPKEFHRNFFLARHSGDHKSRPISHEDMADFFVKAYGKKYDFDRDDFLATMESFSVIGRTNAALSRAKSLGISSVPEIVVDGRFRVNRRTAGSYADIFKVVNQLLELVRLENANATVKNEKSEAASKDEAAEK